MNLSNIRWTTELVEEWLQIAVKVDKVLPSPGPRMAKSRIVHIPDRVEQLWDELRDNEDKPAPKFQPTNEQVSMWEEVSLRWMPLVDSDKDKKIVWWRSKGMAWSKIAKKIRLSRQTISVRYAKEIERLAYVLNNFYPIKD